jgi:hypothetical protein
LVVFFALLALTLTRASAQAPIVTPHTDAPPTETADAIEALLGSSGDRVAIGDKTLEFWWVKSLPLRTGTTDSAWKSVDEGALVGAVTLSAAFNDARGTAIKPGTYTLRYALQPARLRTREFLLLLPVDSDSSVSAIGRESAMAMSRLVSHSAQPAAWGIVPPAALEPVLSIRRNGRRSASVIFAVPVSRDGADAGSIKFGLRLPGLSAS